MNYWTTRYLHRICYSVADCLCTSDVIPWLANFCAYRLSNLNISSDLAYIEPQNSKLLSLALYYLISPPIWRILNQNFQSFLVYPCTYSQKICVAFFLSLDLQVFRKRLKSYLSKSFCFWLLQHSFLASSIKSSQFSKASERNLRWNSSSHTLLSSIEFRLHPYGRGEV